MKYITFSKLLVYTQDFVVYLTEVGMWPVSEFLDKPWWKAVFDLDILGYDATPNLCKVLRNKCIWNLVTKIVLFMFRYRIKIVPDFKLLKLILQNLLSLMF